MNPGCCSARAATPWQGWLALLCALLLAGCGGGGSGSAPPPVLIPSDPNVLAVSVHNGPGGNDVNILFADVTICAPGSSTQCQTLPDLVVDTGSSGLRLRASALDPGLRQQLLQAASAPALLNCVQFIDGTYLWGPVVSADLLLGAEQARALPIQIFDDPDYASVPPACAAGGDPGGSFHANGIIGLGVLKQDCGAICANFNRNGVYFSCTGLFCSGRRAGLAQQVQNPVPRFALNNNGLIIELPALPGNAAARLDGRLTFGIDTQANNRLGTETVLTLDSIGYLTTELPGSRMTDSFIDSGSNGLYFDSGGLSRCASGAGASPSFYCPGGDTSFQAVQVGANGARSTVAFTVGNAEALFGLGTLAVYPTLAGPRGNPSSFDWGLPFYYGRRVFSAIEGQATARGVGPYVAY